MEMRDRLVLRTPTETHVLGTSEGKDLNRKCRNEVRGDVYEVHFPRFCSSFQWPEITKNHDDHKISCRRVSKMKSTARVRHDRPTENNAI